MPQFSSPFPPLPRKLSPLELIRTLRFLIAAEYEAANMYLEVAEASEDVGVAAVLRDVAGEELSHVGEFLAVLERLNPSETKLYELGMQEAEKTQGEIPAPVV